MKLLTYISDFPKINDFFIIKQKDIKIVRDIIKEEQNNKCKLCKRELSEETGVSLDHQHKTKSEEIGVNGAGLVRGVLCRNCNVLEGKIWNASKRYKIENLSDWLRKLADYLDKENYPLVHPSEIPKEKKISKRNYNSLKKKYTESNRKRKFPEFPKSGKLTKDLAVLFDEFEINPYNS